MIMFSHHIAATVLLPLILSCHFCLSSSSSPFYFSSSSSSRYRYYSDKKNNLLLSCRWILRIRRRHRSCWGPHHCHHSEVEEEKKNDASSSFRSRTRTTTDRKNKMLLSPSWRWSWIWWWLTPPRHRRCCRHWSNGWRNGRIMMRRRKDGRWCRYLEKKKK